MLRSLSRYLAGKLQDSPSEGSAISFSEDDKLLLLRANLITSG